MATGSRIVPISRTQRFMAPSCVDLESVHMMDGQHKFQFEKVLPLLTQENCLEGKKTITTASCRPLDVQLE